MSTNLNLEQIRLLREKTGAGLMDCRQALTAAAGDVGQAIAALREKGFEAAAKKAERRAVEGIALARVFGDRAVLLELNAETDFTAGHALFLEGADRMAAAIAHGEPDGMAALLACPATGGSPGETPTVGDQLQSLVMRFRENIVIRRFARLAGTWCTAYTHQNGRIGVILSLDVTAPGQPGSVAPQALAGSIREGIGRLALELALQIAAMGPQFVARDRLDPAVLAEIRSGIEAEVAGDTALSAKPQAVRERIAAGRLEKFLSTRTLLEQAFIRDDSQTVQGFIASTTASWPVRVSVAGFHRFVRGEGLESSGEASDDVARAAREAREARAGHAS